MKAYIHAFRGKPWNEECRAAFDGFQRLGIECVLFSTNEQLAHRKREDVVVGGMLIMSHALSELGIIPPIYDYPEELMEFTGRNIRIIKRNYLKQEKLPVFIKPVEEKSAKGIVVRSWEDISEYDSLAPETEIYCSEVLNFVSEWRCFIRYGKIIGICFYNGDKNEKCDISIIEASVKCYKDIPSACALDFGKTDDGKTLLIEMNDGFALGCYGLDDMLYAKFLTARWAELTGTDDIFAKN